MLPVSNPAELALLELAAECGIPGLRDPRRIQLALTERRCTRESRIQQLEAENDVLRHMRIPHLEGKVRKLAMERDEWNTIATAAEKRVVVAMVLLVVLGAALVIVAGAHVGWGVI
jgi:hypothetical protein